VPCHTWLLSVRWIDGTDSAGRLDFARCVCIYVLGGWIWELDLHGSCTGKRVLADEQRLLDGYLGRSALRRLAWRRPMLTSTLPSSGLSHDSLHEANRPHL